MSSTHRPAGNPAQPARSGRDGMPSSLVPNWARAVGARPRKVAPLRHSAAPPVAPTPSSPGGPAPRISGPDLLAQDEVFRQLLSATSDPPAAQPLRDPVGLALGVVARLIVAACAAAVLTMLLIGLIPPPSPVPAPSETAARLTVATPAAKADATVGQDTTVDMILAAPAAQKDTSGDASVGAVAAAAPVRVPTVSVHSRPADAADEAALDPDEVARLVQRGEESLAQGDIAAARLILGRAADARDARAALSFGATFDPAVLRQLHVLGFKPDIVQARAWYGKAAAYGSAEAAQRLAALPRPEP